MYHPLIGISGSVDKEETQSFIMRSYFKRLTDSGAIPLLLSPDMTPEQVDQCAQQLDGLLLAGGNDVDPALFHEEPIPQLGEVNPIRDRIELLLVPAFLRAEKPILCICRGIQTLNVALGGTLYQDLPSQYTAGALENHSQEPPYSTPTHSVKVAPGTAFALIAQADMLQVNSMHHQAVKDVGPGLTVCARSESGVIEAVEMPGKPFVIGVQWHPERLTDPASLRLFDRFVSVARENRC